MNTIRRPEVYEGDHLGRSNKDFAIEFGEYLANAVERLLKAEKPIIDADEWLNVNTHLYEFRKRVARTR